MHLIRDIVFRSLCAKMAARANGADRRSVAQRLGASWAVGLLVLSPASSLGQAPSGCTDSATVFTGVHVVRLPEGILARDRNVVVEGDRITRVLRSDDRSFPAGARIVGGEGERFLLPGLTDAHVHLSFEPERWMGLFLANGVTTVFNQRGGPEHLELRERIRACALPGPDIYTAGPYTNEPGVRTAEEARTAVERQRAAGYDFVKIHGPLREEAFRALVAAGERWEMPVTGHVPRNLPLETALDGGQRLIAHAEELIYTHFQNLDETRIPPLAARMSSVGVWLIPTLSTFANIVTQWGDEAGLEAGLAGANRELLPPAIERYWREANPYLSRDPSDAARIRAMHEFQITLVRALQTQGVPILTGTDTPLPVLYPGFSLHDEIEALIDAGLTVTEALSAATVHPGRFVREHLDTSARFGRIAEDYRADMVLLRGDPLTDPSVLRTPEGLMVRGIWYDRARLSEMVEAVGALRGDGR